MSSIRIPSPRGHRRARIEIIPLIDIMFFLLATFVMVSLSMVKSKGLPVHLPSASTSQTQDRDKFATVTITEANEVFINKQTVAAADLPAALQRLKADNPDPKVFLNGDEKSLLGTTIGVLDELRRAGITQISFETKPKK